MAAELTELLVIGGAIVLLILVLRWRKQRRRGAAPGRKLWHGRRGRRYRPWDQEAELLRLCHGDRALAERLIAHELERAPELTRAGAALAAATRLRHDKR